jgi:hypothetical protein
MHIYLLRVLCVYVWVALAHVLSFQARVCPLALTDREHAEWSLISNFLALREKLGQQLFLF